ncbi:Vps53-like protein [Pisolithus orientalis]|uniref:Vps53-like protein n=1 Tax=Pisolithus orientalis TaxID=936130 RepID=UPI0022244C01|nr:Vps53-like protein [Pisolithus orientalis]KAI6033241.1 Vps53-like protein [Pisolithus orientalis]
MDHSDHVDLSEQLIQSVHKVLQLDPDSINDPLDELSNEFNPVDVLNQLFPDEASLTQLEAVQGRLAEDERLLQQEIDTLEEELRRDQDPNRIQLIQEMISDILGQMSRIREKASESEAVVRNITKDIQNLDLAKRNLTTSMTTLKRLQMLANALTQLEDQVREKRYSEVAQTLAAVKEISAAFKSYTSVPYIARLWKRIQQVTGQVRSQVDSEFEVFYLQDPAKQTRASQITDACAVVDVLGLDVRTQLIERYVAIELKEYRRIFRANDEAGHLDNISRRFAWFRRLLTSHETETGRVFPVEWQVGWWLFTKFVAITRDDLSTLLSKAGPLLTLRLLLETLQQTTEFESAMSKKWAAPVGEILSTASSPAAPVQPLSSAFEPHLGIVVEAQDKQVELFVRHMLAPHRNPKSRGSLDTVTRPSTASSTPRVSLSADDREEPTHIVMPSSTELFYFYAQSLEQCAKLSTGQALFDLYGIQKKWLKIYAEDILLPALRRSNMPTRKSLDTHFDAAELRRTCLVVNTADYCQRTALELEDKIKEKLAERFKERVTLQTERDLFMSVISGAINCQLRELETACEGAFATLSRVNWSMTSQVSGHSAYVDDLVKVIELVVDQIKHLVEQKKFVRNFLDKACSLILTRFTNALVKSRPLREIGAEQLLIDLGVVKSCLLKLPSEALSTSGYTRSLTKITTRLEALLKVIVTPVDPPEGFILNYTLLIGDASFSNFQKILDLKGTPKLEQNSLLDTFVTIASTKTELNGTSFLSSLDMDPPPTVTFGSPAASRVALPLVMTPSGGSDGGLGVLNSSPSSGPPTGLSTEGTAGRGSEPSQKREVFSDIRRFVSFGLRRDTQPT